ncbi:hypothetical protein CNMCM8686_000697 [Aspergillus fumigatus]|nr:hypothetical protein CNMCM8686_000697 [Aspergillus fumigatus]
MANRTLESFYKPIRKPGKPRVEDTPPPSYSHHPSYPFPIADLPPSIANTLLDLPATPPRSITNQPHLDLLYYQPFIPSATARELFHFLRRELPFYRVQYTIPWRASPLLPLLFGIECNQFDCVSPRMITISPSARASLTGAAATPSAVLCFMRKSRFAPSDNDAMHGFGPRNRSSSECCVWAVPRGKDTRVSMNAPLRLTEDLCRDLPGDDRAVSMASSLPVYSLQEVSRHNIAKDLWIVIEKEVYDVTQFQAEHPGGARSESSTERPRKQSDETVLRKLAGKDATEKFLEYHDTSILTRYRERLQVGVLVEGPEPQKGFLSRFFRS